MDQPAPPSARATRRIRDPRDFWAGLLFLAVGLGVVVWARRYAFGTTAAMGPGYFPAILGWILAGLGAIVGARSLRPGKAEAALEPLRPRPLLVVLASIVVFGFVLPRLGLVVASILLVVVSRLAAPGFRWLEVVVLGVALTIFCTAVFVWGLEMPMAIWPPAMARLVGR